MAWLVGEGPKDDVQDLFVGLYYRRAAPGPTSSASTSEVYYPIDERLPRVRQLPDSRIWCTITDLYTAEELKTSLDLQRGLLPRAHHQDGLHVRLDGPDGLLYHLGPL